MREELLSAESHAEIAAPTPYAGAFAAFLVCCLLMLATGAFESNLELSALSAVVLFLGMILLQRPGESQILLFVFGYHWVQASTGIFLAALAGKSVDDYFPDHTPVGEATILTLVALGAMAIGIRAVAGPVTARWTELAHQQSSSRSPRSWFFVYLIALALGAVAHQAAVLTPSLLQILEGLASVRWAFFYILAVAHFRTKRGAGLWFPAAFLFEFASALGGYFSDFKTVFIFTLLAMLTAKVSWSVSRMLQVGAVGLSVLGLAVVWTAIKADYRAYVSGGERAQIVTVGYVDQMQKLSELTLALKGEDLAFGVDNLMARLSYVEFFGATLAYVPARVPHEGGAILADAVSRPFMPRLLFPEKTAINDSDRTNYYTGLSMAGAEQGTSISLGWIAELYIDFGAWGMMLAALLIGAFYGLIYRFLTSWSKSRGLLGYATATVVLVSGIYLESSITKVMGGLISSLLATTIVIYLVRQKLFAPPPRVLRLAPAEMVSR